MGGLKINSLQKHILFQRPTEQTVSFVGCRYSGGVCLYYPWLEECCLVCLNLFLACYLVSTPTTHVDRERLPTHISMSGRHFLFCSWFRRVLFQCSPKNTWPLNTDNGKRGLEFVVAQRHLRLAVGRYEHSHVSLSGRPVFRVDKCAFGVGASSSLRLTRARLVRGLNVLAFLRLEYLFPGKPLTMYIVMPNKQIDFFFIFSTVEIWICDMIFRK